MPRTVLVTGGAGFIGSHLVDRLLALGHRVRILDNLSPQVHGPARERPAYLDPRAELRIGDVEDPAAVREALDGADTVFHLAARVGVGQSMYEMARYTATNNVGTAVLLELLADHPVQRLVVASSMSIYGEGLYRAADGVVSGRERPLEQLRRGEWELDDGFGGELAPLPTPEDKTPSLASVYALSKFDQERMCLIAGRAYGIPTVALRIFNVYGTRQALSNPYTGVLAIFASRILNGHRPLVFEDGMQRRDFVNVADVVQACELAMEHPDAPGRSFNVGSGAAFSVLEIARELARSLGRDDIEPKITQTYRVGDIRHCFADISLARRVLGYSPRVSLADGMGGLVAWLQGQVAFDRVEQMNTELSARGLALAGTQEAIHG